MCVIYHNPAGVKASVADLEEMWQANPHGAGFACIDGEGIVLRKGFMKREDLFAAVMTERLTHLDVVFHFRIATSGKVNAANTQPFSIGEHGWERFPEMALAHNGVLYKAKGDKSDTHELALGLHGKTEEEIADILQKAAWVTLSSFALITKGEVRRFGDWHEYERGFTSNTHWTTRPIDFVDQWYYPDYDSPLWDLDTAWG